MGTNGQGGPRQLRLPLVLQKMLASDDPEVVAVAEQIADLPSPDPLCPFCVVINALDWPEYATLKLCVEHLPIARALPDPVEWWPVRAATPVPPTPQEGEA